MEALVPPKRGATSVHRHSALSPPARGGETDRRVAAIRGAPSVCAPFARSHLPLGGGERLVPDLDLEELSVLLDREPVGHAGDIVADDPRPADFVTAFEPGRPFGG